MTRYYHRCDATFLDHLGDICESVYFLLCSLYDCLPPRKLVAAIVILIAAACTYADLMLLVESTLRLNAAKTRLLRLQYSRLLVNKA